MTPSEHPNAQPSPVDKMNARLLYEIRDQYGEDAMRLFIDCLRYIESRGVSFIIPPEFLVKR